MSCPELLSSLTEDLFRPAASVSVTCTMRRMPLRDPRVGHKELPRRMRISRHWNESGRCQDSMEKFSLLLKGSLPEFVCGNWRDLISFIVSLSKLLQHQILISHQNSIKQAELPSALHVCPAVMCVLWTGESDLWLYSSVCLSAVAKASQGFALKFPICLIKKKMKLWFAWLSQNNFFFFFWGA